MSFVNRKPHPEVYDYDHNNHGMRIVEYINKIVSTIAWLTDGPWQDLPNYYVNFNQPTVDNVVKLITHLQVSLGCLYYQPSDKKTLKKPV